MTRHINDAGVTLVKSMEGLRLQSYRDPAGIVTIGYGHTLGVHLGQHITEAQADAFLRADMAHAEQTVEAATQDVSTSDGQFSAMVSLTFNIGSGGFRTSTVMRQHRAGQFQAAGDAFLLWDKAHVNGGLVVLPGLLKRRQQERLLYLDRAVDPPAPQPASDPDHSAENLNHAEWERVRPP